MQTKHPIMTYAYHFLSEALILFLLALPIFHFYYMNILTPYWTYFGMIVLMCLVFSFYTKKTNRYGIYLLTAPVFMVIFYLAGIPVVMSILLPSLLTWRYLNIRKDAGLNRESTYLKWTVFLTLILVLMIKDMEIVIYALLLFLNLMAGYMMSHLAVIEKEERKQFNHSLWGMIIGCFIIGAIGVLFAFDFVRFLIAKIWGFIQFLLLNVIEFIASIVLPFFDFTLDPPENELKMDGNMGGEFEDLVKGVQPSDFGDWFTYLNWLFMTIVVGLLIFIVLRLLRRKFELANEEQTVSHVSYYELDRDSSNQNTHSFLDRIKNRAKVNAIHPARKLVYQFEKRLAKQEFGRRPYETIEEWLKRIQMDVNIHVYQKVRYGEQDVTEKELEDLKSDIKAMETKLEGEL